MGVEPTGKSPNGSENSALDQSAKLTRRRLCNSITILKTGLVCVSVCLRTEEFDPRNWQLFAEMRFCTFCALCLCVARVAPRSV